MKITNWLKILFHPEHKSINLSGKHCQLCTGDDIAFLILHNTTTGVQLGEKNRYWITCSTCAPAVEKMLRHQFACIHKSFSIANDGHVCAKTKFWEPD